jgi:hypothetical protein
MTAAAMFVTHERALDAVNAVTAESPLNLVAAAALWAGVPIAPAELVTSALVLKPSEPFLRHEGST